ncbi:unnamed protein product, partial [Symbiodinium microadriaticum]
MGDTPWCYYKAGASTSCFVLQEDLQEPFSDSELSTMNEYFFANINIESKGGVVAAPDNDTPGGSYYFHWMRDGALTMRTVQETASNFTDIESTMKTYVQWVINAQAESDPNGQDVRTATALMIFADALIENGQMDYVQQYLWTGDSSKYQGGAIKRDLDYI